MSRARVPVPVDDGVVERAVPGRHRLLRVGGQLDVAQALGDAHVVGVDHAGHALAHRAQVLELGVDERPRVERRRRGAPYRIPGMTSCGCVSTTWYCSWNACCGELPVHREPAGVPPLGPQRLDLPRVEDGGDRLDALPQRRRVVVEVDPRAPAPHLAPHRRQVDVAGLQVVLGERPPLRDVGVRAVGP